MRKVLLLLLAAAALAVPAAALADHGGGGPRQATYELEGTLSAYTPANGATNGSLTILVSKGNGAGRAFVGQTLTFPISSATQVQARGGTIADGTHGKVQVKGAPNLDATGLQALAPKEVEAESRGHGGGAGGGGGGMTTTYQLRGTLSAYTAAAGAVNGSVTILVTKANTAGAPFVGQTLTFPVSSTTQLEPAGAVIADGDAGSVQVKGAPGLDATGLQALAAKEVEDDTLGG